MLGVPVDLIGIGYKQTSDSGCVASVALAEVVVLQQDGECRTVYHQFPAQRTSQTIHRATFRNRQHDGFLMAVLQVAEYADGILAWFDGIATASDLFGIATVAGQHLEGRDGWLRSDGQQLVAHGVQIVVVVDVDVLGVL